MPTTLDELYAWLNAIAADTRKAIEFVEQLKSATVKPAASSPVDSSAFGGWGANWFDASPFGKRYGALSQYHTGADLNQANYADSGKPVYAAMDGVIGFAGEVEDWQKQVVIVAQRDGTFARYAHITINPKWKVGNAVRRGEQLGVIADYGNDGKPNDHLHFDVAKKDIAANPGDWPGYDLVRLTNDYLNPLDWLKSNSPDILAASGH